MQNNTKILVACSGGKDSTATLIKAIIDYGKENIVAVYNDTGWDHPKTYEYIAYLKIRTGVEFRSTIGWKGKNEHILSLPDLIRKQGRFPTGGSNFCTMYLKQYALVNYFRDHLMDGKTFYKFQFGIRTEESTQRAKKYNGILPTDCFDIDDIYPARYGKKLRKFIDISFPIIDWSEDQVFQYIKDNHYSYNPLYDEGTNDRVGCYPCMLAGKVVQEKMFKTKVGKQRLQIIRQLEDEIGKEYTIPLDDSQCSFCKS